MKFNKIALILFIIIFISLNVILYIQNQEKIKLQNNFEKIKLQNDTLNLKIDSLQSDIEKYSRLKISKISKVNIPKTFSFEKVKALVDACQEYKVPIKIACRLIYAESTFKQNAISYAGAKGYMQLMPNTIKHISQTTSLDINDKHWNIKMGIYYIGYLYNMFKTYDNHTRWKLTILSYNIGPTRVKNNVTEVLEVYKDYKYLNKILGDSKLGNLY